MDQLSYGERSIHADLLLNGTVMRPNELVVLQIRPMMINLWVNIIILILCLKDNSQTYLIVFIHVLQYEYDWVSCHMSQLIILPSIYWLKLINPIPWLNSIYLINLTHMLFPLSPHVRCWKTLPIELWRIQLVRIRPHAKYTRTVYPYITGSGRYVNPSWAQPL